MSHGMAGAWGESFVYGWLGFGSLSLGGVGSVAG